MKCHDGVYYVLPIGDDDGDNVITIELTDGVTGEDDDEEENGTIVDDGGPGYPRVAVGGYVRPVDKFGLLVPWIALGVFILAGGLLLICRRLHI